jgi:hypothetical protein
LFPFPLSPMAAPHRQTHMDSCRRFEHFSDYSYAGTSAGRHQSEKRLHGLSPVQRRGARTIPGAPRKLLPQNPQTKRVDIRYFHHRLLFYIAAQIRQLWLIKHSFYFNKIFLSFSFLVLCFYSFSSCKKLLESDMS